MCVCAVVCVSRYRFVTDVQYNKSGALSARSEIMEEKKTGPRSSDAVAFDG